MPKHYVHIIIHTNNSSILPNDYFDHAATFYASFQLQNFLLLLSAHPLFHHPPLYPKELVIDVHKRKNNFAKKKCGISHSPVLFCTTAQPVHSKEIEQHIYSSDQSSHSRHQGLHALQLVGQLPDVLRAALVFRAG